MNLHERVQHVHTREDFVSFARDLLDDLAKNPQRWENATVASYLEALAGWTADMDGWYANRGEATPAQPSWQLLARILLVASTYE